MRGKTRMSLKNADRRVKWDEMVKRGGDGKMEMKGNTKEYNMPHNGIQKVKKSITYPKSRFIYDNTTRTTN